MKPDMAVSYRSKRPLPAGQTALFTAFESKVMDGIYISKNEKN
jgi:hypothetical protein